MVNVEQEKNGQWYIKTVVVIASNGIHGHRGPSPRPPRNCPYYWHAIRGEFMTPMGLGEAFNSEDEAVQQLAVNRTAIETAAQVLHATLAP